MVCMQMRQKHMCRVLAPEEGHRADIAPQSGDHACQAGQFAAFDLGIDQVIQRIVDLVSERRRW